MVSLEFFIDTIIPAALWPCGRLSLNRNEYQECFLRDKGGRCAGLTTLPPSCANCLEILEPQPAGTPRSCPGLQWDCFNIVFYNRYYLHTLCQFTQDEDFISEVRTSSIVSSQGHEMTHHNATRTVMRISFPLA
jgi:hypothetical protein